VRVATEERAGTGTALLRRGNAGFTASANGLPAPTVQWQVSTNNGVTFSDIPGADTTTLALTDLQVTNSGEYRLEASNAFGSTNSTAATLIVQPVSAEPQPQIAGDVIVDLQSQDLSANNGTWPNRSVSPNTVGDFFSLSTTSSTLNVTNLIYNFQPIEVLAVDGVGGNAVQSTLDAPTEILGNSPFSAEAWIFATITDTTASDVLAYGLEGGAAAPADERAMGYVNEPYGAFTGDFGSSDTAWSPAPTTGVWHYLAWTYNGTNVNVYQDGELNGSGTLALAGDVAGRRILDAGCGSGRTMVDLRRYGDVVGIELSATMLFNYPTIVALAEHLAKKVLPQTESDSDIDVLGDSDGSVLSELFDSVESAPAGSERGL